MDSPQTYSLFMGTDVSCRILGIDPQVMLETAGLANLAQDRSELRVTAGQYFDAWNTIARLSPRRDFVPYLGVAISRVR
ncbi:hypothetical protein [Roseovarius mucosus]|uniref:hypothetical protein n=1 Tax=Roseovarius mucosus TaxID=215743 RepID=UPI0035CEB505